MRIAADLVTGSRLVLLPLPVWMAYHREAGWYLGALAVYVLLGLTDALDGYLARRFGGTPFGAFLDPIVDKIFLVATYLPMVDLGIVPVVPVVILFVREFAVTALRSTALQEGARLRTSRIAKLKTTVQMAGAGFLLLVWMFPEDRVIGAVLSAAVVVASLPLVAAAVRGRRPGWMAWSAALLVGYVGATRALADRTGSIAAILAMVLAFTLISGAEYAWELRSALRARLRRAPSDGARLALLSLAVPLGFVASTGRVGAPVAWIFVVVAAELACGGLDNSLAELGVFRAKGADLARALAQLAGGLAMAFGVHQGRPGIAGVTAAAALLATLSDFAARLVRHRDALRSGARPG